MTRHVARISLVPRVSGDDVHPLVSVPFNMGRMCRKRQRSISGSVEGEGGGRQIYEPDGWSPGVVQERPQRRLGSGGLSQGTAAASQSCMNIACIGYRANELPDLGAASRQRTTPR